MWNLLLWWGDTCLYLGIGVKYYTHIIVRGTAGTTFPNIHNSYREYVPQTLFEDHLYQKTTTDVMPIAPETSCTFQQLSEKLFKGLLSLKTSYAQKSSFLYYIPQIASHVYSQFNSNVLIHLIFFPIDFTKLFLVFNNHLSEDSICFRAITIKGLRPLTINSCGTLTLCLRSNNTRKVLLYATLNLIRDSTLW